MTEVNSVSKKPISVSPKTLSGNCVINPQKEQTLSGINLCDTYKGNSTPPVEDTINGLKKWFAGAEKEVRRSIPQSVKDLFPRSVKNAYHGVVAWLTKTEEAKKAVQTAKDTENDPTATPEAKAKAKAAAGNAVKEQMRVTLASQNTGKNSNKIEKGMKAIDSLSDEKAIAMFEQINAEIDRAHKTDNDERLIAAGKKLVNLLKTLKNQPGKVGEKVIVKENSVLRNYSRVNKDLNQKSTQTVKTIEIAPKSAENGTTLNGVAKNTGSRAEIVKDLVETVSSGNVAAPSDILEGLKQNEAAEKILASNIIQVAEAKGYKLDNFAQLASIAGIIGGDGAEGELVATTDIAQLNVLSKVKQALNNLFTDVSNMLRENRDENRKLDEASAKVNLEKKRDELKQIDRDFIEKLLDKNIQNKLHMEVMALSYLLQNPEQITQELIDAIKDQVNKIKLKIRP